MAKIEEKIPEVTTYRRLRKSCGLSEMSEESAKLGLPRSLYSVVVIENNETVGMGRVIGDLGCFVQIVDIAVHPDYQGKGFGRKIMDKIMSFVQSNVPRTCFVNLFADIKGLYEQFGFVDSLKSKGMYLDWDQMPEKNND